MADYPNSIYNPRVKANKNGVVYDENDQTIVYVEDITKLEAEVIALETFLRIPTSIHDSPVAGSAYFTTDDFILHIYTGAAWKTIQLT